MTTAVPALARLRAVVDELVELPLWQLTDDDEADLSAELERSGRRLASAGIRVIADIDSRNVAGEQAGISTLEFLRRRLRLSPSEAKSRIRAAGELVESVTPSGESIPASLPETAAGVATGELSLDHARVISRAIEKLPSRLDPAVRAEAQSRLAADAHTLDPAQLSIAGLRIHTILDPDGLLDADRPARRELAFVRDAGGCDLLRGRLDAESAAIVRTAVDAISAPGAQDTRAPARRRADGLVELCRRYLDSGQLPIQAARSRRSRSQCNPPISPRRSIPVSRLAPHRPAASPATPASSRRYWAATANRSMSAAPPGRSRPRYAAPSSFATGAASIPIAIDRPNGPTRTTSNIGSTVARRHWTISACSATSTTGSSTTRRGESYFYKGFHT